MRSNPLSALRPLCHTSLAFLCLLPASALISADPTENGSARWQVFAGTGRADSPNADLPTQPTLAALRNVYGIEVTPDAIYFSTIDDHSIWKCDRAGKRMHRIAGTGEQGFSGDGGPALKATFNAPHEIRADDAGHLFVADTRNHCIRRIDLASGIVETVAGDGTEGFQGDGGPAGKARFKQPHSIVLDRKGGLFIADTGNHRLRYLDLKHGTVSTLSGDGRRRLPNQGSEIKDVSLFGPRSLAIDDQAVWLVLREGNSVWRIDRQTDRITRVAGTGDKGHTGDDGKALDATFRGPKGIAVDSRGRLLIVDTENQALRRVDVKSGIIETLDTGYEMKRPHGTAVLTDRNGIDTYLISDSENHRILSRVDPQ